MAAPPLPREPWWSRRFGLLFMAVLCWRLGLAAALPFLGDEAYFTTWGRAPALGYYDHPPMIGWWLAPLVALSSHPLLLRLPTVLVVAAVGWALWWLVGREGSRPQAAAAALALLLSPFYLIDVLVLTDTPLILFCFASGVCYWRAVARDSLALHAAAGALLGLAFLSKYLAVLLGLAYLVRVLAVGRDRRQALGLLVLLLAAAPFVAFNLWWNAHHCWSNLLFNLYNRHVGEAERYTWRNVLYCALTHLWMLSPVGVVFLARSWRRLLATLAAPELSVPAFSALVPLTLLSASSLAGPFGAYWVLAFYPFLFLLLPRVLGDRQLGRLLAALAVFGGLHAVFFSWAVTRPLAAWREAGFYDSLAMMERPREVASALAPYRGPGTLLAAEGYSPASLLAWATGEPVAVFGVGSHYARQDDLALDWRRHRGERVVVWSKKPPDLARYSRFFARLRSEQIEVAGAAYHLVIGDGLDVPRYRDEVLTTVRERYYRLPDWLPAWGCPFVERYWPPAGLP